MWSRVKTANEIVSSWKSRRGPGGIRPGSALAIEQRWRQRWWRWRREMRGVTIHRTRNGGSNSPRDFSPRPASSPIACVNRVNGQVNDGEEVLINDNGRGMRASRREEDFAIRGRLNSTCQSAFVNLSRLTSDNEQSRVLASPNYRINWRLAA